jgi:tetratricopeptide (TPR) repeat protein
LDWGPDERGNAHPGGPFWQAKKLIVIPIGEISQKTSLNIPTYKSKEVLQSPAIPLNITINVTESNSAYVWYNKGIALNNLGKCDEAIKAFDKAIELNTIYEEAWNNKGIALSNMGKYDEAINAYDEAIKLDQNFSWAWYNKCNALLSLGGRYNEAIKAIDSPVILNPSNEWAWIIKAQVLKSLGCTTEADAAIAKANKLGYKG